ncbi:hypothetical protein T11_14770 [Trichinella zimbabwensis]|uniref:Uncharacterized protein n=1 Tax=Trichinella zimbabwensis TaxID=268475 RepID=A0A0V1GJZ0_9BILA|nr:hypothetical protein T11_16280 [Trichinella zimbabwensis]KRZ04175.1 hypothetical protein T11_14770 [Trichinella zimbabwensis]
MAVCIMSIVNVVAGELSTSKFSGTYPILLKKCGVL